MHFKHPEILYFLFLLIIPIIVHLFQLRRFKKEYFTNVDFLKELSIQTRKSSKIKKWLLLATRMLLLAALIFAFAQPFFEAKDNKNATNELYIILDNSYSMQAKGKTGELLKRAVEDLLLNTPQNQNFSLITNTNSFWNTDIKTIQSELQQLNFSAEPFNLATSLAQVNARKSPYKKDIVVITDGVGSGDSYKFAPENTLFVIPQSESKNNTAIDSVFISQTLDNFYEIGVNVHSFGEKSIDLPLSLYNNDKLVAKTQISPKNENEIVKFMIPKKDFHGYATISDNGLAYDNTYYFSIDKPLKSNVISIGSAENSKFLSKIFTTDEFQYSNFTLPNLDYNLLDQQDAIILNEINEIPQALQTTLKSFVMKGGNLVVIPALEMSISDANNFLKNFGTLQYGKIQESKLITQIAFGHPLYNSVFEKKIQNFQYPNTKNSFAFSGNLSPILSYEDKSAFLTAIRNLNSYVYIFAAPISKNNSNFQNSPLIVPTFYNMGRNASKAGISANTIGNSKSFFVTATLSKDEILSVNGADSKFIPIQQIMNNKVKFDFQDYPKAAGNFVVMNQNDTIKNISFNYNRTEGNLSNMSEVPAEFKKIDNIETVFDKLQTDRTNNEIWKFFVMLVLLFVVTELLIQKFVK